MGTVATVGTLTRCNIKKGMWRISCQPHVSMRLKRVFARIDQRSMGNHWLSDTPENALELQWFMERYPLEVTLEDATYLASRANEHRERETVLAQLLAGVRPPLAFELAVPPREYQRVAAAAALASGGLLLADDLGLGKTVSAITMLTDPRTLPALVVTLTHLPRQWQAELRKFAPSLRTHILASGTPYDLTRGPKGARCLRRHRWVADALAPGGARCASCDLSREDAYHGRDSAKFPDVVIANYHKLAGWAETLGGVIKTVVWDEAQELRRPATNKYEAASHLAKAASYRMGLTATPVYNQGAEFWSVMDVIRPDALGTLTEFTREWCVGDADDPSRTKVSNPQAFGAYVRSSGLMLRRTRADVARELPALTRAVHIVDADEGALDKVSGSCAELARTILRQGERQRGEKMLASEEFSNRLRQATGIAKAPYVADFVRLLLESERKVVVFAWHREVYSILEDRLRDAKPVLYTGSESPAQKEKSRLAFVEGDARVLLMSLRSGAGLDGLQHVCRTPVFAELDWSPGVIDQCCGRVHRDGQTDPVVAYILRAESGADPVMCDVLLDKRAQAEGIRNPDAELVAALGSDASDRVKLLAQAFLAQQGLALPEAELVRAEGAVAP